jgi:3D (Asp-Asp-Asp) domain-containing protein
MKRRQEALRDAIAAILTAALCIMVVVLQGQVEQYKLIVDDMKAYIATLEQDLQDALQLPEPQPYGCLDGVTITHYCTERYPHVCNGGPPYRTRSGTVPTPGRTCAVDPRVIPLGSEVTILYGDGSYQTLIAEDTGGSIKGSRIDVVVSTHEDALRRGVTEATRVYWREPT